MNPCERFQEAIFDFLDGELDVVRKRELEHHLKTCSVCASFLEEIRRLRSDLKHLTPVKTSESFQVLLRERIRREIAGKGRKSAPFAFPAWRWIPALGFGVLVMIGGLWMLDQKTSFFHGRADEPVMSRSSVAEDGYFDGQVQYIVGEFPNRVSLSRVDTGRERELTNEDSVQLQSDLEEVRARLTPVSF